MFLLFFTHCDLKNDLKKKKKFTFGIGVEEDLDVGRWNVALLFLVPPDTRPAISFILLDHKKHLSFC